MNRKKVLVVVDMQNDFISGSLGTDEAKAIVPNVVDKVKSYMKYDNHLILFTVDTHISSSVYAKSQEGKLLPVEHCILNTEGCYIVKELGDIIVDSILNPDSTNTVLNNTYDGVLRDSLVSTANNILRKGHFGSFKLIDKIDTNTYQYINKLKPLQDNTDIESIEICGLCTDICVVTNALILKTAFPEIPIYLDATCCAGSTPEKHKAALEVLKSCQILVTNDEM